ncbi:hypothetical protein H6G54_16965 [Anabaena cylindrica FACHB-243]|uniref:Uncharacterized protein n=1 Tax=Anabaena cylindrica (strain ATCC 27899 / PCC 7122) TaxID=272123 RepID=K9ZG66_ANACC|nr:MULTISPECIES: hypothetical protein [Anabaena]AFZ57729.1 hypothetical protein Anacy_2273 [Anabaena cylindrica PCC 7122]AZL96631.1 hypothetical protein [Anabaena sp. CCAP 1446/1C]MBD2419358.1 hypothetical protein [Anabaena cylindrica FACHB-243]MBY5285640.1 hypothetical protein [Anabaena sp. CCAP 1446/1C]MBY5311001.1 hypothetical protein [Anabaena sp. CCAP 1446/1C]
MQIKGISIALVLGLSLPIATDIAVHNQAVAGLAFPDGEFFAEKGQSHTWHLTLWEEKGNYYYKNLNLKTGKKLCLVGARASGTKARPVFTWTNGKFKYQVAWQTVQSDLVRLQVINPAGQMILNELLIRQPGEFEDPNATKC